MTQILTKIISAALSISALSAVSAQKSDAKSKQILNAVSANYKSKKNTYFKFVYGTGSGKVTKSETGIFYATPSQYRLRIMGTEQIFDGSKVYSINDEDKEVTIATSNGSNVFSPISYLDSYKKDFNASYQGKKTVNGVSADFIKLTPAGKDSSVQDVYIFVNSAKKQMLKIEQYSKNKDVSVIAVQDYRENQTISPQTFNFDRSKYKNYIITEL